MFRAAVGFAETLYTKDGFFMKIASDVLHILLTSLCSLLALFVLTKLLGNRQMSQMSLFDYINGITIGSIAAEFATSLENDFIKPLTAMAVYGLVVLLISWVTCKSFTLRKFFNGKPIVLYENNTLFEANLLQAKMDINEFLTQCRVAGYFDLGQLEAAFLETNGQISFLPKAENRPVTPEDLQMTLPKEGPCATVIIDGILVAENLQQTGNNEVWLYKQLDKQHAKLSEIFLATCSIDNQLEIYKKTGKRHKKEIFE